MKSEKETGFAALLAISSRRLIFAAASLYLVGCGLIAGQESKSGEARDSGTNSISSSSTAMRKTRPHKLTGAELYSIHCARCHPERYPTERTAAQWKTILLHMRVRANLPAEQARTILKYLQDNSGR